MIKLISTAFSLLLVLAGTGFAQNDLLSRVPQLQETARSANGGASGCGEGAISLVTNRGNIVVGSGLDAIHVFGNKIIVADLLVLLEARIESNRTGEQNPMSGEVGDLAYVILSTLAESKDSTVIPVIAKLLDDKEDTIRGWSTIALLNLAKADKRLLKMVAEITFPKAAAQSAKARSVDLPTWVKVKKKNGEL